MLFTHRDHKLPTVENGFISLSVSILRRGRQSRQLKIGYLFSNSPYFNHFIFPVIWVFINFSEHIKFCILKN